MIGIPDSELGELGRLIATWANAQRFGGPSVAAMGRELGVTKTQVGTWLRGDYVNPLKPLHVEAIAKMIAPPGGSREVVFLDVLNAVLRDTGHLPKAGRLGERRQAR